MKRLLILVSALVLLLPVSVSAQGGGSAFSMAAGVSLGVMDGAGVGLAFGATDWLRVRAGYSVVPSFVIPEYSADVPKFGNNPAFSTALTGRLPGSGNLLVDFHPGGGSFRVTAGAFFGSGNMVKVYNTKALPDSYHSVGVSYYVDGDTEDVSKFYRIMSDAKGIMTGYLKSGAFRPFLGIGFGSAVPKHRIGAAFDLGVEYTGGLDLSADATNIKGDLENITINSAGVRKTVHDMAGSSSSVDKYDKYIDYIDKLHNLPVLPVMRFSIFVKLF